jgi:hypothetical protein
MEVDCFSVATPGWEISLLSSNASAQGLVSQKDIPLAMAKTIAEAQ